MNLLKWKAWQSWFDPYNNVFNHGHPIPNFQGWNAIRKTKYCYLPVKQSEEGLPNMNFGIFTQKKSNYQALKPPKSPTSSPRQISI